MKKRVAKVFGARCEVELRGVVSEHTIARGVREVMEEKSVKEREKEGAITKDQRKWVYGEF